MKIPLKSIDFFGVILRADKRRDKQACTARWPLWYATLLDSKRLYNPAVPLLCLHFATYSGFSPNFHLIVIRIHRTSQLQLAPHRMVNPI